MAIIDPKGLFQGERLGACSDKAKLFWPWLFTASNGYARLELSYRAIVADCFRSFAEPPTEEQLWSVLEEYATNFLVILYEAHGVWWAQFDTSEKYLPRYKTKRDEQSPVPPRQAVETHRAGYLEWKKAKSFPNQRFQKFSANFAKIPEFSAGIGGGIGEGVGDGGGAGVGTASLPQHAINNELEILARGVLQAVKLSTARSDVQIVAEQINYEAPSRGGAIRAAAFIKAHAQAAMNRGEHVTIWFFRDREFAKRDRYDVFSSLDGLEDGELDEAALQ